MKIIGKQGGSIALVGILILSGMLFVGGSFKNASATSSSIYSDAAIDGYLENNSGVLSVDTTAIWLFVGQLSSTHTRRSYISFDTSGIPLGATISSATLTMWEVNAAELTPFSVLVYRSGFTLLDVGDWNDYSGLEGTMPKAGSSSWNSLSLNPDYIVKGGTSEYCLRSSIDEIPYTGLAYVDYSSGDFPSNAPRLALVYTVLGCTVHLELTGGAELAQTGFPEISEWNLTYDLYRFDVDTVPLTENITIDKESSLWTLRGMTPACTYTETSTYVTLTSVYTNITYRIWLTVPKSSPYCTVHVSTYNLYTGEGYFWEQMRVEMCDGATWDNTTSQSITKPDFYVEPNATYTLRVLDFFGNMLTDYVFVANSANIYLAIPVPYYSWQIFNMNDAPVLMRIYWNNSGNPWEFFVGPNWIMERFLKGGNYTFMVTFYNTDGTAGSTVYYTQTIPLTGLNASFVYVNGTGLSQIISSIEGVMALQTIITSLISPSMVIIYEDLPLAPVRIRSLSMSTYIAIDPYLILEATTYQNKTGLRFVNSTLLLPHAQTVASTYYIIADTLSFSGTFATNILINNTAGTNLYSNTVLPATVIMHGENITIWATENYSVSRATTFREISEYMVNYYATQKKYETAISLNNTCPFDYYSPYWYIAFPQNTTIDQDTVTLFDLDNNIYLSQRTNFDVTAGGIHVTLNRLNSSDARNFRLTYWDANGSSPLGIPNLIAESYTQSTLNGVSMKYTAVQWTNPWSVAFVGNVWITLNFSDGDNLLMSSMTIIDETTGLAIPNTQWIYTGRTILILSEGVGSVPVGGARNYGIYFTLDAGKAPTKTDFFFGPIIWNGQQFFIQNFAVSWMLILLIVGWALVGLAWWNEKDWAGVGLLMWGSVTIILFYFQMKLG